MRQNNTVMIYLQGMSCTLCAKRIEDCLGALQGVSEARVDFGKRIAHVRYSSDALTPEDLCRAVEAAGYGASTVPPRTSLAILGAKLAALWGLYFLLERSGILNLLVPTQLADSSMSYGMLFVTGLLTSVHCVAMCGGIGLSQSMTGVKKASVGPVLQYHLGRLVSYTALGAALGALGGLTDNLGGASYWLQGALKLLAGAAMLFMGLNMLELLPRFPRLSRWHIRLPKPKGLPPFGIGLLNGFMPCGPLQSMLLLALASGSALRGGLSMLCFSLGTMPLLLGFASMTAWLGKRFTGAVLSCGAVLIAVFGLSMLSQGGSLTGLFTSAMLLSAFAWLCVELFLGKLPIAGWKKGIAAVAALVVCISVPLLMPGKNAPDTAKMENGIQVVESTLTSWSYADIRVTAGIPVKWTIYAEEDEINGCNNRMICRDFGIEKNVQSGENIIEFTPETSGTYSYSCWMGMIHGTIIVE